ncbi:MAG: anti-sigma factor antagonist [Gammaproteobacteria bacterium]|nr:MAG: anti-sigma factor antagonist [Gammaproteobacteria bacterium]
MKDFIKIPKRFDYSVSSDFNAAVTSALANVGEDKKVTLDCAEMEYLDSAGIGLIVMAHKRAVNSQCRIAIINTKPAAREILLLANLQKLIDIR